MRQNTVLHHKMELLKNNLKKMGRVGIAFSGGVDSTFLLKVAHEVLGKEVIALTVSSCFIPKRELREAEDFCKREGIRQIIVPFSPLSVSDIASNPPKRCYYCKTLLFQSLKAATQELKLPFLLEGSNKDDIGDYRPGLLAIKEQGIRSPLMEADLSKDEIRTLSHGLGLPSWNKPSFACLASRFPYDEPINTEGLSMVEKAEDYLFQHDFSQFRVRIHGKLARIEILKEDFDRLMEPELLTEITDYFRSLGFLYVTLDLCGYRTGSMNEVLPLSSEK